MPVAACRTPDPLYAAPRDPVDHHRRRRRAAGRDRLPVHASQRHCDRDARDGRRGSSHEQEFADAEAYEAKWHEEDKKRFAARNACPSRCQADARILWPNGVSVLSHSPRGRCLRGHRRSASMPMCTRTVLFLAKEEGDERRQRATGRRLHLRRLADLLRCRGRRSGRLGIRVHPRPHRARGHLLRADRRPGGCRARSRLGRGARRYGREGARTGGDHARAHAVEHRLV